LIKPWRLPSKSFPVHRSYHLAQYSLYTGNITKQPKKYEDYRSGVFPWWCAVLLHQFVVCCNSLRTCVVLYPVLSLCAHKRHIMFWCNLLCVSSDIDVAMKNCNVGFWVLNTSVVQP
jgi:hypothetical protein